jgi:hypothetical protein
MSIVFRRHERLELGSARGRDSSRIFVTNVTALPDHPTAFILMVSCVLPVWG